ncbi:hypothetical protein ERJ75_000170100 [Trypanosoma vivax]|nr:hypothetical protein ERJ75_000170100 [Trypanosoma vivax]
MKMARICSSALQLASLMLVVVGAFGVASKTSPPVWESAEDRKCIAKTLWRWFYLLEIPAVKLENVTKETQNIVKEIDFVGSEITKKLKEISGATFDLQELNVFDALKVNKGLNGVYVSNGVSLGDLLTAKVNQIAEATRDRDLGFCAVSRGTWRAWSAFKTLSCDRKFVRNILKKLPDTEGMEESALSEVLELRKLQDTESKKMMERLKGVATEEKIKKFTECSLYGNNVLRYRQVEIGEGIDTYVEGLGEIDTLYRRLKEVKSSISALQQVVNRDELKAAVGISRLLESEKITACKLEDALVAAVEAVREQQKLAVEKDRAINENQMLLEMAFKKASLAMDKLVSEMAERRGSEAPVREPDNRQSVYEAYNFLQTLLENIKRGLLQLNATAQQEVAKAYERRMQLNVNECAECDLTGSSSDKDSLCSASNSRRLVQAVEVKNAHGSLSSQGTSVNQRELLKLREDLRKTSESNELQWRRVKALQDKVTAIKEELQNETDMIGKIRKEIKSVVESGLRAIGERHCREMSRANRVLHRLQNLSIQFSEGERTVKELLGKLHHLEERAADARKHERGRDMPAQIEEGSDCDEWLKHNGMIPTERIDVKCANGDGSATQRVSAALDGELPNITEQVTGTLRVMEMWRRGKQCSREMRARLMRLTREIELTRANVDEVLRQRPCTPLWKQLISLVKFK